MSYCILYKRIFIRTQDDNFIALVEAGESNLWSKLNKDGGGKRARGWGAWSFGENKFAYSENEINAWIQKCLNEAVERAALDNHSAKKAAEMFGYYKSFAIGGKKTYTTTFRMFKNFFSPSKATVVSFDDYVRVFGGLYITYWDNTYHKSKRFVSEHELMKEFNALKTTVDAVLCIEPEYYPTALENFCAIRFGRGKKSVIFEATFKNDENNSIVGYVKNLLPFQLTSEQSEAVPISFNTSECVFNIIHDAIAGYKLDSLRFEYV